MSAETRVEDETPKPKRSARTLLRTYITTPHNRTLLLTDQARQHDAIEQARTLPDSELAPFMIGLIKATAVDNPKARKAALIFLNEKYELGKLADFEPNLIAIAYADIVNKQAESGIQGKPQEDILIDLLIAGRYLIRNGVFVQSKLADRKRSIDEIRRSWDAVLTKITGNESKKPEISEETGLPMAIPAVRDRKRIK